MYICSRFFNKWFLFFLMYNYIAIYYIPHCIYHKRSPPLTSQQMVQQIGGCFLQPGEEHRVFLCSPQDGQGGGFLHQRCCLSIRSRYAYIDTLHCLCLHWPAKWNVSTGWVRIFQNKNQGYYEKSRMKMAPAGAPKQEPYPSSLLLVSWCCLLLKPIDTLVLFSYITSILLAL